MYLSYNHSWNEKYDVHIKMSVWRQAIIWTNSDLLSIGPIKTNFNEIRLTIQSFSFNAFENVVCEMEAMSSRRCVNSLRPSDAYMRQQTSHGSDTGVSPGRRQAIIWTNAGILLIGPLGTNVSEISIEIHTFSFKEMHLNISSGK